MRSKVETLFCIFVLAGGFWGTLATYGMIFIPGRGCGIENEIKTGRGSDLPSCSFLPVRGGQTSDVIPMTPEEKELVLMLLATPPPATTTTMPTTTASSPSTTIATAGAPAAPSTVTAASTTTTTTTTVCTGNAHTP